MLKNYLLLDSQFFMIILTAGFPSKWFTFVLFLGGNNFFYFCAIFVSLSMTVTVDFLKGFLAFQQSFWVLGQLPVYVMIKNCEWSVNKYFTAFLLPFFGSLEGERWGKGE